MPIVDRLPRRWRKSPRTRPSSPRPPALGIVPTARGPKEFAAFIKSEVETNTALLKDAGYKPE